MSWNYNARAEKVFIENVNKLQKDIKEIRFYFMPPHRDWRDILKDYAREWIICKKHNTDRVWIVKVLVDLEFDCSRFENNLYFMQKSKWQKH